MRIAVSSTGINLDASVDPRFGRCVQFLIVETDNMSFQVFNNQAQFEGHGAGISAAQNILSQNINVIITGNIGPNAFRVVQAANVKVYMSGGNIKEAINKLLNNELPHQNAPTNTGHYGRGSGAGRGRGRN
ncbi:MAG TPA: NifB/NifX family molybdenum-iron cluster-binding protein [candidate division Zixibacteria bacterium]|nr:NifB/NifX family molybdenum-iron cluster-binding protein [candidate division Zixibacteria bacterium]